jgi:hypothetical protein
MSKMKKDDEKLNNQDIDLEKEGTPAVSKIKNLYPLGVQSLAYGVVRYPEEESRETLTNRGKVSKRK